MGFGLGGLTGRPGAPGPLAVAAVPPCRPRPSFPPLPHERGLPGARVLGPVGGGVLLGYPDGRVSLREGYKGVLSVSWR